MLDSLTRPVSPPTGIVITSWPDMDREARDQYLVVVQVKDMLGLSGGYSSSTTVTVSLTDVNDNGPAFRQRGSRRRLRGRSQSDRGGRCYPARTFAGECNHSRAGATFGVTFWSEPERDKPRAPRGNQSREEEERELIL